MRLADLEAMRPGNATLRNLVRVLGEKLDAAAALSVFAYEAERQGYAECTALFHKFAADERRHVDELVAVLLGLTEMPQSLAAGE